MITVMIGARASVWSAADQADAHRLVGPDRQEGVQEAAVRARLETRELDRLVDAHRRARRAPARPAPGTSPPACRGLADTR